MLKTSKEVQEQSMNVAKANQRPNQTKEQTKLIAQGIEKGIAEYKKQQKKKARERDKLRKIKLKDSVIEQPEMIEVSASSTQKLPWILLTLSWGTFIGWFMFN